MSATTDPPPYGAARPTLTGTRDAQVSRWLWLVKWLLLVPHVVVLVLLWIGFVLCWLWALFGIAFTGAYPRAAFDYNVGVIRWSWRVAFYGYGALGTDRYPPFTLRDVPDYPATVRIPYPTQLSRSRVWVKWWLLALPHYLVLALLTGSKSGVAGLGGLLGLLVLFAAVTLLFTGRYPRSLFDLVMGIQRWAFRVLVYTSLMTDDYPPFRIDPGGEDVGGPRVRPPAPQPVLA